ncbi:methyl-accepting chemotaxis protein [Cellvibrio sp. PSBB023]|uniref:methyl-accepting chemotaxis protein n=1 Tax=Cellvibrio sp. PSBB023 TaxID=1945512 RepID=UPI00143BC52A|nr:methyl-accepting chemotaxis protein [Cellvibrio sp. PSBB023]
MKSWVLLTAILCNVLLVAGAIVLENASVWLLVPLLLIVVLILGIVGGVNKDMAGIKHYLSAVDREQPVDWNQLVSGPLQGLHDTFIDVFKSRQRRNAEYKDAVKEMGHSSLELAINAKEVSKSAAYQSSATTSSAAAITEISHSIDDISNRIGAARTAATTACDLSKQGGSALASASREVNDVASLARETETRVSQLDALMHDVTSMSKIISDIAGQTNLLALNAAIEAARAGEQGRGFAVVADEVRALATRSHGSAAEIATNIARVQHTMQQVLVSMKSVVEKTDNSLQQVASADSSLTSILTTTDVVFGLIDEITIAAEQQSIAAREISTHIETVADLANQNSFRAGQAAEIADHLHKLTHQAE